MHKYFARPTEMGWELVDQQSQESVIRTITKDEMYGALDVFMDGKTASVEVFTRDGKVEEERAYPGSSHLSE